MKPTIYSSSFVLCALVILTLVSITNSLTNSSLVDPKDYPENNVLVLGARLTMYWLADIENDIIEIALKSTVTNGWIAIGIDPLPDNGMHEVDCILAYPSSSGAVVEDMYITRQNVAPVPDTSRGGQYSIIQSAGVVADGFFHVKFTRSINATDASDKSILDTNMRLSWAINTRSTNYLSEHSSFGIAQVNMLLNTDSPPTPNIGPKIISFKFHLVVTVVLVTILIASGLAVTLLRLRFGVTSVYYWLCKKSTIRTRWSIVNEMLTFTVGEIFAVFCYIVMMFSWFLYGFYKSNNSRWAKGLGYLNILSLSFVLLPVTRHSVWTWIFNISYERAVRFHRFLGTATFASTTAHFICLCVEHSRQDTIKELFEWKLSRSVASLAGFIAWLFMIAISITSIPPVRRFLWTLFQICHVFLAAAIFTFAMLHIHVKLLLPYIALSLVLYIADIGIRYFAFLGNRSLLAIWKRNIFASVKSCKVKYHSESGLVHVSLLLDKCLVYNKSGSLDEQTEELRRLCLGKYLHLWIWQINPWESHPFSIAEIEVIDDKTVSMSLFVKKMGSSPLSWTGRLAKFADSEVANDVTARFDGPFGSLTIPLEFSSCAQQYDLILLFGGGVGITALY